MDKKVIVNGKLVDPVTLHLDEPVSLDDGNVRIIIIERSVNSGKRVFGSEKGSVVIHDTFDEPLDEFSDYI
jgi:hypothetical protein